MPDAEPKVLLLLLRLGGETGRRGWRGVGGVQRVVALADLAVVAAAAHVVVAVGAAGLALLLACKVLDQQVGALVRYVCGGGVGRWGWGEGIVR